MIRFLSPCFWLFYVLHLLMWWSKLSHLQTSNFLLPAQSNHLHNKLTMFFASFSLQMKQLAPQERVLKYFQEIRLHTQVPYHHPKIFPQEWFARFQNAQESHSSRWNNLRWKSSNLVWILDLCESLDRALNIRRLEVYVRCGTSMISEICSDFSFLHELQFCDFKNTCDGRVYRPFHRKKFFETIFNEISVFQKFKVFILSRTVLKFKYLTAKKQKGLFSFNLKARWNVIYLLHTLMCP